MPVGFGLNGDPFGGMTSPYQFYQTMMRRGALSPMQIDFLAMQRAREAQEGLRSQWGQTVDRAASLGGAMPWVMGARPSGQTLGAMTAGAQGRMEAMFQNQAARMQGAQGLAGLNQLLAQLQMVPTAPTEMPQGWDAIQALLEQLMAQIGPQQLNLPTW